MLPIAFDRVQASIKPELPRADEIILRSAFFGAVAAAFAFLFIYTIGPSKSQAAGRYEIFRQISVEPSCSSQTQAAIWLYLTIASQLLIFTVRVPQRFFWKAAAPHPLLLATVFSAMLIVSLLAGVWQGMWMGDIMIVWGWGIGTYLATDAVKVVFFRYFLKEHAGETIGWDQFVEASREEAAAKVVLEGAVLEEAAAPADAPTDDELGAMEESLAASDGARKIRRKQLSQNILAWGQLTESDRMVGNEEVASPAEEASWSRRVRDFSYFKPRAHRKLHKR